MESRRKQEGDLNRQADEIEQVLSSLALPVKIQGGHLGEDWVRYQLAPMPQVSEARIRQVAEGVAKAMGVTKVEVTESEGGVALEFPLQLKDGIQLLPLLQRYRHTAALHAILGLVGAQKLFTINFRDPASWHFLTNGPPGSGKSEMLRTLILSLAAFSRQSQLKFLGIDLGGRDLMVMEALPHGLAEVAVDYAYAVEILNWLEDEIERREAYQIKYPEIVLVVDDAERLLEQSADFNASLQIILQHGRNAGIHLFLASEQPLPVDGNGVVTAMARTQENLPGDFMFEIDGAQQIVKVAWLPVHELRDAVYLVREGWRNPTSKAMRWSY